MTQELTDQLAALEEDYFHNPPFVRRRDLVRINELRQALGQPVVDEDLRVIPSEPQEAPPEHVVRAVVGVDRHPEARALYQEYLDKVEAMRPHREYCEEMIRATAPQGGQTPVMPLATRGTGGGPILCDSCAKEFPLEGGNYHRAPASAAWKGNPEPAQDWCSFIYGHVTFLQEANGTFRAYHGHMNRGCGAAATTADRRKRDEHQEKRLPVERKRLHAFFEEELGVDSKAERDGLINELIGELFRYDPGVGINHP